jgi:hypothetical protein
MTLREEHRLGVFENRMLRRIFGPKRVEELHDLYSLPSIIRIIMAWRMGGGTRIGCWRES